MNGFEPWENMRMLGPPTEKRTGLSKNSIDDAARRSYQRKGDSTARIIFPAVLYPINKDARITKKFGPVVLS
jgi:hypothetical protein